jgi:sulfonate transport system permease protein
MKLNIAANTAKGLLLPLALLAVWEWASRQGAGAAYVFVPLEQLANGLAELLRSGELWLHLRASLTRTLQGLLIGGTLGIATGTLMAQSRVADRLIGPLFHSIRQVPLLGLVPLIGLWVGSGDAAKLLVIVIAAFYPTVLNTAEGMRQVDVSYREVGRMLTLTRSQTFRRLLLPAALPAIVTGITHAQAFGWLACVGGELLFAAGPGIGSLLINAEQGGRMEVVLLAVLAIALLAQAMNFIFQRAARLLVRGRSSL